jgi:Rieske Fe-S protein
VAVAAGSPLAAAGGAALVQSSSGSFLVTRTAADAFSALTATCTHEMCTITGFANQRFICPCHGSSFDAAGNVITGPAVRSLRSLPRTHVHGHLSWYHDRDRRSGRATTTWLAQLHLYL